MAAIERNFQGEVALERDNITRDYFDPQLGNIGLTRDQISKQSLEELNESLVRVNDAISHPDGFGTLRLRIFPSGGRVNFVIADGSQDAQVEVSILPLLLERKSLILNRLKNLLGDKTVRSLGDLVASVADPDLRAKIEGELSAMAEHSRRLVEQEGVVAQLQAEQITKRDEAVAKLRVELFERRLRAWTGFFARESMATYIGAFLLIMLTLVQIWTMLSGAVRTSEIINNAFLLLLGYFFGQSAGRVASGLEGRSGESRN
jgi:hypothetical protein